MGLPRMRSPRAATSRRVALWSALAVGGILPSVGCQVEYAGMTLPSGKYMHDDVQYFPAGPEFPWANTQAATQRARMRAMGIEPPPPAVYGQSPAAGAINPIQNQMGRPTDINVGPFGAEPNTGRAHASSTRRATRPGCSRRQSDARRRWTGTSGLRPPARPATWRRRQGTFRLRLLLRPGRPAPAPEPMP